MRQRLIYIGLSVGVVFSLMLRRGDDAIAASFDMSVGALRWGIVLICVVTCATIWGVGLHNARREYVARLKVVRKQRQEHAGDDDPVTPS